MARILEGEERVYAGGLERGVVGHGGEVWGTCLNAYRMDEKAGEKLLIKMIKLREKSRTPKMTHVKTALL